MREIDCLELNKDLGGGKMSSMDVIKQIKEAEKKAQEIREKLSSKLEILSAKPSKKQKS